MALTRRAHELIQQHFVDRPKQLAIDATCGNGYDCDFLLTMGFAEVIAFDIQQSALENTRDQLSDEQNERAHLVLDGHQNMGDHVSTEADCIVFNLGYLPHADKSLTTEPATTLAALDSATTLLSSHGLISVLCYPGHPRGSVETQAVKAWTTQVGSSWVVTTELSRAPKPTAPILIQIKRIHA